MSKHEEAFGLHDLAPGIRFGNCEVTDVDYDRGRVTFDRLPVEVMALDGIPLEWAEDKGFSYTIQLQPETRLVTR